MGPEVAIPSNRSLKIIIPYGELAYKHRNRIEHCFGLMKHFRRFVTGYPSGELDGQPGRC